MTIEKLNKIIIGIIIISFLLFFFFLNIRYIREYPQIFTPSETIEVYTTSETPFFEIKTTTPPNY